MFKKMYRIPPLVTLIRYKAIFTTIDGKIHEDTSYNYGNPDALTISIPDWIMQDARYLKDENKIFYPMSNILSIKWVIDDVLENVIDKEKVFYEEDEIEFFKKKEE